MSQTSNRTSLHTLAVEAVLASTPFAGRFHHLPSTTSTNTLAIEAAQAGAPAGVWLADEQTAGRGRGGHRWHSSAGDGLYLSVLLRPRLHGSDALKLSLATGLACKSAVEQLTGLAVDLRWPNDLLVRCPDAADRKFGGILTESAMAPDGTLSYAVIGIGMNLNHTDLPGELRPIATSLRLAGAAPILREDLLSLLLPALTRQVHLLEAEAAGHAEAEPLLLRFERASTWIRGLRVHVAEDDGYTGLTAGLTSEGLLLVKTDVKKDLVDTDSAQSGPEPSSNSPGDAIRTVRHGGVRRA